MSQSGRRPANRSGPLTGSEVQRQILSQALQHPLTLYPAALCALAFTYGAFIGPFVGGEVAAWLVAAIGGMGSAASFSWRYLIRGEESARRQAQQLIADDEHRRHQTQEKELQQLASDVRQGLEAARSEEGLRALDDLEQEYERLCAATEAFGSDRGVGLARFSSSAVATYQTGLRALDETQAILHAVLSTDREDLQREMSELRQQIHRLENEGSNSSELAEAKSLLRIHQETLELLEQRSRQVSQLLDDAQRAEAALRQARINLPALEARDVSEQLTEASLGLDQAVGRMESTRPAPRASNSEREAPEPERQRE